MYALLLQMAREAGFSVIRISGRECIFFKNIWKMNNILVQLALGNFSKLRLWRFINGQFIMIWHSALATSTCRHASVRSTVPLQHTYHMYCITVTNPCVWFGLVVLCQYRLLICQDAFSWNVLATNYFK